MWPSEDPTGCIGSRCPLWTPELASPTQDSSGPVISGGGRVFTCTPGNFDHGDPTGRGWCADNLRREPWPDPAAKEQT